MFINVNDLPKIVQTELKNKSFFRKDIHVEPATQFTPQGAGGRGVRCYTTVIDLSSNKVLINKMGSWGGANIFNQSNSVDLNSNLYPLPINHVVIKGQCGYNNYASILVHPDTILKYIEAPIIPLTDLEIKALYIIRSIKAGYRKEEFIRHGIGEYNKNNPLIISLKDKGFIMVNGRGIQVTTEGKNRIEDVHFII